MGPVFEQEGKSEKQSEQDTANGARNGHVDSPLTFEIWFSTVEGTKHVPTPRKISKELGQFLSEQCSEVELASWYFSGDDDNTLIVTGNGVTKICQDENIQISTGEGFTEIKVLDSGQTLSLDFHIEFVDTESLTNTLSAKIDGTSCEGVGTCELLICTDSGHYAATACHVFVDEQEIRRMPSDQVDDFLSEIIGHFGEARLTHKTIPALLDENLSEPPLGRYRLYADSDSRFMNDIALLKLAPESVNRIMARMATHCTFNQIVPLKQRNQLDMLIRRQIIVLAAPNRKGRVVARRHSLTDSEIADHISFVLEDGDDFVAGDSGSTVLTRSTAFDGTVSQFALAMLRGYRPGSGPGYNRRAIYEAIVLNTALQEALGHDNLDNVRPFPFRPVQPVQDP